MEITQLIAKYLEETPRGPVAPREMQGGGYSRIGMCLNLPFFSHFSTQFGC